MTNMLEAPNLEAMEVEELVELEIMYAGSGLAYCAKRIRQARQFRLSGEIEKALKYEKKADAAYQRLKPYQQW